MAAVWLTAPALGLRLSALSGCTEAGQVLELVQRETGLCDFYIVCNGRVVDRDEPLRDGSIYRLEPRLRGGKGGFGSMLRALGAQIEKTTNREACRDLSGRRLRDVNHEKEMADWLKKQSEREAEKEQRRLERLQKKLAEPKHHFTDSQYTRQCHELSERLEDSVIKGLQASSSSAVRPDTAKRPSEERDGPEGKRSRGNFTWTGLDLDSDEDLDPEEAESEDSGRSSSSPASSEDQSTGARQSPGPSSRPDRDQTDPESSCGPERDQGESSPEEVQRKPESSCGPERDQREPPQSRPEGDQGESSPEEVQRKPESSSSPDQEETKEQRPQDLDLDLDSVSCAEDLEALGLNVLKEELMRRGLKCGGTLSERAARLFSVRGKRQDDFDHTLLAKSGKKKAKQN